MIGLLILSVVLNCFLIFGMFNSLKKIELFEEYFGNIQSQLITVLNQIRSIDIRGSFEADDEVGLVFKGIKGMIDTLDKFMANNDGEIE